ncbi:MAG: 4-(cytidine 5'-diphospho)-2-C-methyl-D-erythritol kinase [Alphaproteobacteria bacterium]
MTRAKAKQKTAAKKRTAKRTKPAAPSLAPPVAPVVEPACAKINLFLHILGKRKDGYHLLDSLVVFADVHDTIEVRPAKSLSLTVKGPFAAALKKSGATRNNLVLRAARALQKAAKVRSGAAIALTKRMPVASGIGGGSADAAATLRALARLWQLNVDDAAMAKIGLALGADVPVCLAGKAAYVGGVGDALAPASVLPAAPMVLVNPGIAVPTKTVFKRRTGAFSEPGRFADPARNATALGILLARTHNDLTVPALGIAPVIADIIARLFAQPGCSIARMSGSGATCYGIFETDAQAEAAAAALRAMHRKWWVQQTQLVADTAAVAPIW